MRHVNILSSSTGNDLDYGLMCGRLACLHYNREDLGWISVNPYTTLKLKAKKYSFN